MSVHFKVVRYQERISRISSLFDISNRCVFKFQKHLGIPFLCKFCGRSFQDPSTKSKHEQLIHGKSGSHTERKLNNFQWCSICGIKYCKVSSLADHLKTKHSYDAQQVDTKEMRFFECHHCNIKFSLIEKEKLLKHLIGQHFQRMKPKSKARKLACSMNLIEGKYQCKVCGTFVGPDKEKAYCHIARVG